jgi:hypothetical protein
VIPAAAGVVVDAQHGHGARRRHAVRGLVQ